MMLMVLSDREPFEVLRWGPPFCFSSPGHGDKCEAIQFISSVVVYKGHLIIGYGVNDCESRFWIMTIDEANSMLDAADTANDTAPGAAAALNPLRTYVRDSYFEPELRDAFLLKMSCDDARFPHCRPINTAVTRLTEHGTQPFINFNPSIVVIEPFMRDTLPFGALFALLRLCMDYCEALRSYGMRKDPNSGAVVVQVQNERFEVLAQTYIELCSSHPPDGEIVDLDNVHFAPKNIWWGDMNAYPPIDRRVHACGLLAGEVGPDLTPIATPCLCDHNRVPSPPCLPSLGHPGILQGPNIVATQLVLRRRLLQGVLERHIPCAAARAHGRQRHAPTPSGLRNLPQDAARAAREEFRVF